MKEYIRPEIELIKFNTEVITDEVTGEGSDQDNVLSGDLT